MLRKRNQIVSLCEYRHNISIIIDNPLGHLGHSWSFMVVKSAPAKMLANSDDLAGRPYRIRTCDTLIKSQVLFPFRLPMRGMI